MPQNIKPMRSNRKSEVAVFSSAGYLSYFCKIIFFPALENKPHFRGPLVWVGLLLFSLLATAFDLPAQTKKYLATDEYRNEVFTLELRSDQSYRLEERYLDGSIWVDEGSWEREGNEIKLRSFKKTARKHNFLTFKPTYKFKGDVFKLVNGQLQYGTKGQQKLNGHYRELAIKQVETAAVRISDF
jgi:hypothetical protein